MAVPYSRYLALMLLLIAATVSYAVGSIAGFWMFILVGAVFEVAFWVKLFFGRHRRP